MTERFLIPTPIPTPRIETVKYPDRSSKDFAVYLDESGRPMKWGASFPIPTIGSRVFIVMNGIGWAFVEGYFESDGYLGVMTRATNPPRWLQEQRRREAKDPHYHTWPNWRKEGIGCEFGSEIRLERPATKAVKGR
jgi:hypothetical protein